MLIIISLVVAYNLFGCYIVRAVSDTSAKALPKNFHRRGQNFPQEKFVKNFRGDAAWPCSITMPANFAPERVATTAE